jgi:hypothetical protein
VVSSVFANALNLLPDLQFIAESLVAHSLCEELIEVEVVLHQELHVRNLKLQSSVPQNVRVGENVDVERTRNVGLLLWIPFKSSNPNLKSIHPCTGVLDLLVAAFRLVKTVLDVLLPHR